MDLRGGRICDENLRAATTRDSAMLSAIQMSAHRRVIALATLCALPQEYSCLEMPFKSKMLTWVFDTLECACDHNCGYGRGTSAQSEFANNRYSYMSTNSSSFRNHAVNYKLTRSTQLNSTQLNSTYYGYLGPTEQARQSRRPYQSCKILSIPTLSITMSDSNPSSSPSASSYDQHAAAIDKITQDAEDLSNQHQTTKEEIAAAIEGAELIDGVLGPAPQENPSRAYGQLAMNLVDPASHFIRVVFGYLLAIYNIIPGAVVAAAIVCHTVCTHLLDTIWREQVYICGALFGFFLAWLFRDLGWT
ncbi:hypothetical protein BKA63DRAFT_548035 [Paraphoma chrysanthemicola]|nr:hypothetical protein BKA63DRAFT_548035 [Paraphoma chrysanthemicola]